MKKKLEPIQIKVTNGDDAWLYVNPKSIDVCIYRKGYGTLTARITERKLKSL